MSKKQVKSVPLRLLRAAIGEVVSLELKSGTAYQGTLDSVEDTMGVQLLRVTMTTRAGKVSKLERAYIRGSMLKLIVLPDLIKSKELFKTTVKKSKEIARKVKRLSRYGTSGRGGRGRGRGGSRGKVRIPRGSSSRMG